MTTIGAKKQAVPPSAPELSQTIRVYKKCISRVINGANIPVCNLTMNGLGPTNWC